MSTSLDFDSISNNDWDTEDLYVRLKVSNEDESIHFGMIGLIQSTNGVCTGHLPHEDRRAVILIEHMELVTPKQNDKIYVIGGNSKNASGDLLSVDYQDGVVQLHGNITDHDISLISLKYLCKCI